MTLCMYVPLNNFSNNVQIMLTDYSVHCVIYSFSDIAIGMHEKFTFQLFDK